MKAVADLVKKGETDLGRLCTAPGINKWALYKPYDAATLAPLTDEERRGYGTGGVHYGLKMQVGDSQLHGMHLCTYEYEGRPKGGEKSPYRLADFAGYNHDARPDLLGHPDTEGADGGPLSAASPAAFAIAIEVREAGDDEVQVIPLASAGGAVATDLLDYYPCAMVSKTLGGTAYVRAMWARNAAEEPRPLLKNGERATDYYLPGAGCPPLGDIAGEDTLYVSYFLLSAVQSGRTDFSEWTAVSASALYLGLRAWGIPEACGLKVAYRAAHPCLVASLTATATADGIDIHAPLLQEAFAKWAAGASAAYRVAVTAAATGQTAAAAITATVAEEGGSLAVIYSGGHVAWTALGILPQKGRAVPLLFTAYNPDGSEARTLSTTLTIP